MTNLLKSEDTKFSGVIEKKERKKGGVMTLVRNNINARETKQYMEEAEYLEVKVTIREALYTMSTTTVLMIRCSH
jgi:hypothetical protein